MLSVWVVWKSHEVKGAYSTLEAAKKAAEAKASTPDGEHLLEWEDEGMGEYVLWATYRETLPDDLMYVTECVVDA